MMTMMMTMRVAAPPRAAFNLGFASQDVHRLELEMESG
jgi:hypothetical protein